MSIKVLIVDDSSFFRKRLEEIINADPELELCGQAVNGKEAVSQTLSLKPDVITMDVEMPVLNGIDAVRDIMRQHPTPVLMFSSLTKDGAKATMDALEAGALDFLPKNFDDIARRKQEAVSTIVNKIKELGRSKHQLLRMKSRQPVMSDTGRPSATSSTLSTSRTSTLGTRTSTLTTNVRPTSFGSATSKIGATTSSARTSLGASTTSATTSRLQSTKPSLGSSDAALVKSDAQDFSHRTNNIQLLAIGSSTGGPLALQKLLANIPCNLPVPVIIMQHMPAAFTGPFAERLNTLCGLKVVEAKDGDALKVGTIYIAPGGKQMMVEKSGSSNVLKIIDGPEHINYKPSVDIAFGSAAQVYGNKVLAVVLTGMGADGAKGAALLKNAGSQIWAQNEETCVIYGMPKAIVERGLAAKILPIEDIAANIVKEIAK